jgi:hypothetical protein
VDHRRRQRRSRRSGFSHLVLQHCPLTSNIDPYGANGIGNTCACDLDNNRAVNQADFLMLRGRWGNTALCLSQTMVGLINAPSIGKRSEDAMGDDRSSMRVDEKNVDNLW